MNDPPPSEYVYNKPPDEKFKAHFRHICWRPAMYVGEVNYKLVATLLEGIALGYQDWHGGFMHSWLHEEFSRFLAKKYGMGQNVVWSHIIPLALKDKGFTEKELIDQLLQDFEDYDNILVRIVVETSDGVEDT